VACFFCGGGPLTEEHVLPHWLREHWNAPGPSTYLIGRGDAGGDSRHTFERIAGTQTVRDICRTCNNGWLSSLEGTAKDILLPMVDGRRVRLDEQEQKIVAAWGVKTMMIYQLTHPSDRSIPSENYEWLREHGEPHLRSEVWIGRYSDSSRYSYYWHRRLSATFSAPGLPDIAWIGYAVGLSVSALVYLWYGENTRRPDRRRLVPSGDLARSLIQIWPYQQDVDWPPDLSLDDSAMNSFLDAIQHPEEPT
jgi:hypothetical protein